jgi:rSAM/selenodomain-associated transferase 1
MKKNETVCAVLLRAPRLGQVKTRLAASLGEERALAIYRALVAKQIGAIPPRWRLEVHFTPVEAEAEMKAWLGGGAILRPQVDGDLGERLIAAVATALAQRAKRCFLIGGDCPALSRPYLEAAEAALADADLVIAPALDGGYALLGLKEARPSLFQGISWGTSVVLEQTLEKIRGAGLTVVSLPPVEDVDDEKSWERNRHLVEGGI